MERNIENIKEKLKALGYLEWRIGDFFVRGKPKLLLLVSKISFVGAVLFGFGFTLMYTITNLPLISNFFDILLLFFYISAGIYLILFLLLTIFGLLINYPLKKLKPKFIPSNTVFHILTIIFSILITGYLFVWFKDQYFPSPYYFFFVLIPLSIIFIIFFRIFLLSIFLLMGNVSPNFLPSKKIFLFLFPFIFITLSFLFFIERFKEDKEEKNFVPENTNIKIAIVGVDGFDLEFANSMMEDGKLPFLNRLFKNGFKCKFPVNEPRIPAVFWTTVATGLPPEEHNIRAFQSTSLIGIETPLQFKRDPSGILWAINSLLLNAKIAQWEPISSYLRSSKTLWEILSEKGFRIGQINWWASWPADEVRDFSVTERAFEKMKERMEVEMDFYPPHIKDDLLISLDLSEKIQPDSFISNVVERLFEYYSPQLFMVYLPGLDIQWEKNFKNQTEKLKNIKKSISEIENAYIKEDSIFEKISNCLKDYAKIYVLHTGRNLKNRGIKKGEKGMVVFQDYPFKKGFLQDPKIPERVAPTALFIAGFPISEKMAEPFWEAISEDFLKSHNIKIIKTFGRKKEKKIVSKFNRELLENLRSLGYIE